MALAMGIYSYIMKKFVSGTKFVAFHKRERNLEQLSFGIMCAVYLHFIRRLFSTHTRGNMHRAREREHAKVYARRRLFGRSLIIFTKSTWTLLVFFSFFLTFFYQTADCVNILHYLLCCFGGFWLKTRKRLLRVEVNHNRVIERRRTSFSLSRVHIQKYIYPQRSISFKLNARYVSKSGEAIAMNFLWESQCTHNGCFLSFYRETLFFLLLSFSSKFSSSHPLTRLHDSFLLWWMHHDKAHTHTERFTKHTYSFWPSYTNTLTRTMMH